MRLITFSIFLGISRLAADVATPSDSGWTAESFSSQFSKFRSVTIHPSPSDNNLVAVYYDEVEKWWGHLRIFKHREDKIEWAVTFPEKYLTECGHYVVSCKWVSLDMVKGDVLEIVDSTHMGNGSLWLFELNGKDLRLLLQTAVRGRCWNPEPSFQVPADGEATFAKDRLNVKYVRGQDGFESVWLTGSVLITDSSGKELSSKPYQQRCVWNSETRVFDVQSLTIPTTGDFKSLD